MFSKLGADGTVCPAVYPDWKYSANVFTMSFGRLTGWLVNNILFGILAVVFLDVFRYDQKFFRLIASCCSTPLL